MNIFYIGNQTAGIIGRLTILAEGHKIVYKVDDSDILLCVHGRAIIPKEIYSKPEIASINVHPYLYAYPGKDPIGRAIKDKNWHASVGCHYITDVVDGGQVVKEIFFDVQPSDNRADIYNQLYPYYSKVIIESLNILEKQYLSEQTEPDVLVCGNFY